MSDLMIRVKLDDKGLDAQMKGVSSKFATLAKGIGAIALPIAAVKGIAMAIDGFAKLGETAIKTIAPLNDTAKQLGVTAERLQELRLVAGNAGVEVGEFDKALGTLTRNLGAAALGQDGLQKKLKTVGLSLFDEQGHIKTTAEVWDLLTAKIQSGALSQEQAVGLAAAAFGREGGKMVAVLKQTAEEQEHVIETARRYGAIISNEVVASADEYEDQLALIQKGTEALGLQTDMILAPLALQWAELKNSVALYTAALLGVPDAQKIELQRSIENTQQSIQSLQKQLHNPPEKMSWMMLLTGYTTETLQDELLADLNAAYATLEKQKKQLADMTSAKAEEAKPPPVDEDPRVLEEIQVADRRIAIFDDMNKVFEAARYRQLDQEIEVGAQRIEVMRSWHEIELLMAQEHEGLLTQAHKDGVDARIAFSKMEAGEKVDSVLSSLVTMTAGVAQHSKKMFELNKLAAIGSAIVNTAQGVTKALASYPPPLSFVMAGAQAAAGAVQIAAIKKTTFQGGGGGTTPSAAGSTPTVGGTPVQGGQTTLIRIEGLDDGKSFSSKQIRQLLEQFNDAIKDGAHVRFGT